MPMDPVTAGLILGFGGNILSGLFGSSAQSAANEANKFLTKETNELNEKLFHENLDFQREMWKKTNDYNSPGNQVGLLRQAGLNPADLMSNKNQGLASSSSPVGVPQMQTANMLPVDAMARSLQTMGVDMANTYLQIAQANKARAEKTGIDTDNKYKAAHHALDLATKGAQKEAQDLMNDFQRQTIDNRVEETRLNNVLISEKTNNLVADTAVKKVTEQLESEKIKLTKKQVEELDALIKKHLAEGDYYVSQKELNECLKNESASRIALNYVNAEMAKVVGYAQAGAYNAQSGMYGAQARYTNEDARLLEKFGEQIKKAGIQDVKSSAEVNIATKIKVMREVKKLDKDLHWYDFDELWGAAMDWIRSVSPQSGYR